jgi:hypothetical protein
LPPATDRAPDVEEATGRWRRVTPPSRRRIGRLPGSETALAPSPTFLLALTISVVRAARSRRNTSSVLLVSPSTRFDAELWNATYFPSAEMKGTTLS